MFKTIRSEVGVDSGQMAVMSAFGEFAKPNFSSDGLLVVPAARGEMYTAFVRRSHEGSWGMRVKSLIVMRGDSHRLIPDESHKVGVFECVSDALIVSDPCYVFNDEYGAGGPYDRACNATYDMKRDASTELSAAIFDSAYGAGQGVCSSSGFGDGGYDAVVHFDDRGAVFIEIVFIPDEDEE